MSVIRITQLSMSLEFTWRGTGKWRPARRRSQLRGCGDRRWGTIGRCATFRPGQRKESDDLHQTYPRRSTGSIAQLDIGRTKCTQFAPRRNRRNCLKRMVASRGRFSIPELIGWDTRRTVLPGLLVAQRHHGIDSRGTTRGNIRSQRGDGCQERCRAEIDQ